MLSYILQTIAFQLLFLIIYEVFLKKETFFNWNRTYLLATPVLSLIIPLVKIAQFNTIVPQEFMVKLPIVFIGETVKPSVTANKIEPVASALSNFWSLENAFYIGMSIAALLFVLKVIGVTKLIYRNPKFKKGNLIIVQLLKTTSAFSFFNYIFLGEHIDAQEKEGILKHEIVHVKQRHSLDLLLFEMFKILFWFNPLVYIYQNKIKTLHEFIADAEALKHQDKNQYYQNLLSQVFETKQVSFINPFFKQSLIKKRIIMLQKSKSKQVKLIKYTLLIPVLFGMLLYTSAEGQNIQKPSKDIDLNEYSYSLKIGEKLTGDKKEIHKKYETLLKENKDFVIWSYLDRENDIMFHSVHHKSEKVPEGFSKGKGLFPDGTSFISYINLGTQPPVIIVSENKKKQKDKLEEKYKDVVEVPYAVVEQVPIFRGCDTGTNKEQKECTSESIAQFVNGEFNTKIASKLNLKGSQRIHVIFKIDKNGGIIGIRSRAPHPKLEEEAIRVINLLPKFQPGEQKGKKVVVTYSLPIIFQVKD